MEWVTTSVQMSTAHKQKWEAVARALGTSRNQAISRLLDMVEIRGQQRTDEQIITPLQIVKPEEQPCITE